MLGKSACLYILRMTTNFSSIHAEPRDIFVRKFWFFSSRNLALCETVLNSIFTSLLFYMTGFVRCDARLLIRRPVKHFNHLTFIPLLPFICFFSPPSITVELLILGQSTECNSMRHNGVRGSQI